MTGNELVKKAMEGKEGMERLAYLIAEAYDETTSLGEAIGYCNDKEPLYNIEQAMAMWHAIDAFVDIYGRSE